MAICGLVITIDASCDVSLEERRAALIARLASDQRITLGDPTGGRLPLVLETTDKADYLRSWDDLEALAEVGSLELACIHFEDGELEYEVARAEERDVARATRREAE